jgi:hypothetical protein
VVASAGFAVTAGCTPTLAPGASCSVTFQMPAAGPAGARTGTGLATALNGGGAVISLSGTRTAPNGTSGQPAANCKEIKDAYPASAEGTYTIDPDGTGPRQPFAVVCDMTTGGGGWTLVAKLTGQDSIMNRTNQSQWRQRNLIGNTSDLREENALGAAYETVPFTDVLIRSVRAPDRNLAWRHPSQFQSMWHVVEAGQRVSNGVKLFGSVYNLDYTSYPGSTYHNDCYMLKYGFFGFDSTQNSTGIAGHSLQTGHTGAVIAASIFQNGTGNYGPDDGRFTNCVTDFGAGACYNNCEAGANQKNLQAHWWGAGNTYTADFRAHAIFVR